MNNYIELNNKDNTIPIQIHYYKLRKKKMPFYIQNFLNKVKIYLVCICARKILSVHLYQKLIITLILQTNFIINLLIDNQLYILYCPKQQPEFKIAFFDNFGFLQEKVSSLDHLKLFYIIVLNEIFNLIPSSSQLDLAFIFYEIKTT